MDEVQGLTPSRFLELLNKPSRTPEEEVELQTELKRQADAKTAEEAAKAPTTDPVSEEVPVPETPATPEVPVEQPVVEVPLVEQNQPNQPNDQEEEKPYDLNQLTDEIGTAVNFLNGQGKTLAVEEAKAHLTFAAYWTKLASEGQ